MTAAAKRTPAETHGADRELWRMRGPKGAIVAAVVRDIQPFTTHVDDRVTFELRVLRDSDVYLTERYTHPDGCARRAAELKAMLEAKNWTPLASDINV